MCISSSNAMTGKQAHATGVRRFGTKLVLYLCGLALVSLIVPRLLMPEIVTHLGNAEVITIFKREWVRNGWVKFPDDKIRVVALGDSRVLAAVDPDTMDSAAGGDTFTFNIAIPASTSRTHAAVLRELIAAGDVPEWILLGISPTTEARANLSSYRSLGVVNPLEIVDAARIFPEGRKILSDWLLPTRRFQREITSWVNQQVFNRTALSERRAETESLVQRLKDDRGIFVIDQSAAIPDEHRSQETFLNINADLDPACREILEIADQNAINVLVISAPIRPVKLTRNPEAESDAVAVGDGLERVHFSSRFFDPLVLPDSDFADDVHLNNYGAEVFSRWLAEEFARIRQAGQHGGAGE